MNATFSSSSDGQNRDDKGVEFGRYSIFPRLRLLLREGAKVVLNTRAFDVLWVLVQAEGELVSKDHLIDTVWTGVVVEENNLQAQMSAIRRALGPDRAMIQTEFGRGYRLVAKKRAPLLEKGASEVMQPPSYLPLPLTSLLGRAVELREIERLFDKSRLVTITGSGGVGKTRLALELGRSLAVRFQDGVHLAEIAKISEDELVGPTLAGALLIPSSEIEHADRIGFLLSGRQLLLIVDNCEHLAGPISRYVETILHHGTMVKVLITSQEPLGLDGEQIYRLAPLAVPPADTRDLLVAMAYPAFELFAERSSANAQSLELEVEVASAICQRLDGLPLALELAAARVATLGVRGVLAALDDRFNLLTAGRRTALSRHRTLRATVDWSYHLLDSDEQRLLCRLALFASSFDAHSARAVAAPESDDPWLSLDLLSSLVGKSLLLLDLNGATPKYRLLETIRFYALEKLAESGDVELSAARHAAHFFEITRRASDDWKKLATEDWREAYETTIDDIRAAIDWSCSAKGDMRIGVGILACATPFWIQMSLHDECRRRITQALDRLADALNPDDEMALMASLGTALSWAIGPASETSAAWHRALTLARELRASEIELQALYGLWLYSLRAGNYRLALGHAEEMLQLSSAFSDSEAQAVGRRISGVAQHFLGNHDLARELIEASLRWFDINRPQQAFRFGIDQRVAGLSFLSRILWVQGFGDQAKEMTAAAADEARALDHANTLCCALAEGWCTVHALEGDCEAVLRESKRLQNIARKHGLGFWSTYGAIFELWAQVYDEEQVSVSRLASAVASVERAGFDPEYSTLFSDILLTAQRNKWDHSTLWQISSQLISRCESTSSWGEPEFLRAGSHLNGSPSEAIAILRNALSISHQQGARAWTLKVATDLATMLDSRGDDDEAKSVLAAAITSFPAATGGKHLTAALSLASRMGLALER